MLVPLCCEDPLGAAGHLGQLKLLERVSRLFNQLPFDLPAEERRKHAEVPTDSGWAEFGVLEGVEIGQNVQVRDLSGGGARPIQSLSEGAQFAPMFHDRCVR